jgi:hypothetical protein
MKKYNDAGNAWNVATFTIRRREIPREVYLQELRLKTSRTAGDAPNAG